MVSTFDSSTDSSLLACTENIIGFVFDEELVEEGIQLFVFDFGVTGWIG